MQLQKLTGYQPRYPRKTLRGAALTAAALVAISGAAGCRRPALQTTGIVPMVTEPPEETLTLDGEVAIPAPTEEVFTTDGEVAIPAPTPEPDVTTTGMVYVPEGGQN